MSKHPFLDVCSNDYALVTANTGARLGGVRGVVVVRVRKQNGLGPISAHATSNLRVHKTCYTANSRRQWMPYRQNKSYSLRKNRHFRYITATNPFSAVCSDQVSAQTTPIAKYQWSTNHTTADKVLVSTLFLLFTSFPSKQGSSGYLNLDILQVRWLSFFQQL